MVTFILQIKGFSYVHKDQALSQSSHRCCRRDALKYRILSPETQKKFLRLFSNGYNAASALELRKYEMQKKQQDNNYKICADRAIVPDKKWCKICFSIKNIDSNLFMYRVIHDLRPPCGAHPVNVGSKVSSCN